MAMDEEVVTCYPCGRKFLEEIIDCGGYWVKYQSGWKYTCPYCELSERIDKLEVLGEE